MYYFYGSRKCIARGDARLASVVKVARVLEKTRILIKSANMRNVAAHVTAELSITTPANEVDLFTQTPHLMY